MNHYSKFSVFKQMPCLIRSFASKSYLQGGGSKEIVRLSGGRNVFKNMPVIHRTFADKSCSKGGGDKGGEEGDKKESCSGGSSGSKSPPKSCSSGQPKAKPKPKENKSCRRGPGEAHFQAAKWRKISLFSVLPAIFAFTIFTFATMHKHERPEFIPYEHLRKRDKKFCWGDGNKTFFHNKHMNALPEGYEDE